MPLAIAAASIVSFPVTLLAIDSGIHADIAIIRIQPTKIFIVQLFSQKFFEQVFVHNLKNNYNKTTDEITAQCKVVQMPMVQFFKDGVNIFQFTGDKQTLLRQKMAEFDETSVAPPLQPLQPAVAASATTAAAAAAAAATVT